MDEKTDGKTDQKEDLLMDSPFYMVKREWIIGALIMREHHELAKRETTFDSLYIDEMYNSLCELPDNQLIVRYMNMREEEAGQI